MNNKKMFYNKTAKGLASLAAIIVIISSILATSIYYNNNITANVIKEISIDNNPSKISIKEINDIKELSQLNEGWYEIRNGFVFYLDTFNSYVPLYVKVRNFEQQNVILSVDENGNVEFEKELNEKIKGSQNLETEPVKVTTQPTSSLDEQIYKSFAQKWKKVGWQNLVLRSTINRVATQPSGFKASTEVDVPALPSINDEDERFGNEVTGNSIIETTGYASLENPRLVPAGTLDKLRGFQFVLGNRKLKEGDKLYDTEGNTYIVSKGTFLKDNQRILPQELPPLYSGKPPNYRGILLKPGEIVTVNTGGADVNYRVSLDKNGYFYLQSETQGKESVILDPLDPNLLRMPGEVKELRNTNGELFSLDPGGRASITEYPYTQLATQTTEENVPWYVSWYRAIADYIPGVGEAEAQAKQKYNPNNNRVIIETPSAPLKSRIYFRNQDGTYRAQGSDKKLTEEQMYREIVQNNKDLTKIRFEFESKEGAKISEEKTADQFREQVVTRLLYDAEQAAKKGDKSLLILYSRQALNSYPKDRVPPEVYYKLADISDIGGLPSRDLRSAAVSASAMQVARAQPSQISLDIPWGRDVAFIRTSDGKYVKQWDSESLKNPKTLADMYSEIFKNYGSARGITIQDVGGNTKTYTLEEFKKQAAVEILRFATDETLKGNSNGALNYIGNVMQIYSSGGAPGDIDFAIGRLRESMEGGFIEAKTFYESAAKKGYQPAQEKIRSINLGDPKKVKLSDFIQSEDAIAFTKGPEKIGYIKKPDGQLERLFKDGEQYVIFDESESIIYTRSPSGSWVPSNPSRSSKADNDMYEFIGANNNIYIGEFMPKLTKYGYIYNNIREPALLGQNKREVATINYIQNQNPGANPYQVVAEAFSKPQLSSADVQNYRFFIGTAEVALFEDNKFYPVDSSGKKTSNAPIAFDQSSATSSIIVAHKDAFKTATAKEVTDKAREVLPPAPAPAPPPTAAQPAVTAPPTRETLPSNTPNQLNELTDNLRAIGYPGSEIRNIPDKNTDAIKRAQNFVGVEADGFVGDNTIGASGNLVDLKGTETEEALELQVKLIVDSGGNKIGVYNPNTRTAIGTVQIEGTTKIERFRGDYEGVIAALKGKKPVEVATSTIPSTPPPPTSAPVQASAPAPAVEPITESVTIDGTGSVRLIYGQEARYVDSTYAKPTIIEKTGSLNFNRGDIYEVEGRLYLVKSDVQGPAEPIEVRFDRTENRFKWTDSDGILYGYRDGDKLQSYNAVHDTWEDSGLDPRTQVLKFTAPAPPAPAPSPAPAPAPPTPAPVPALELPDVVEAPRTATPVAPIGTLSDTYANPSTSRVSKYVRLGGDFQVVDKRVCETVQCAEIAPGKQWVPGVGIVDIVSPAVIPGSPIVGAPALQPRVEAPRRTSVVVLNNQLVELYDKDKDTNLRKLVVGRTYMPDGTIDKQGREISVHPSIVDGLDLKSLAGVDLARDAFSFRTPQKSTNVLITPDAQTRTDTEIGKDGRTAREIKTEFFASGDRKGETKTTRTESPGTEKARKTEELRFADESTRTTVFKGDSNEKEKVTYKSKDGKTLELKGDNFNDVESRFGPNADRILKLAAEEGFKSAKLDEQGRLTEGNKKVQFNNYDQSIAVIDGERLAKQHSSDGKTTEFTGGVKLVDNEIVYEGRYTATTLGSNGQIEKRVTGEKVGDTYRESIADYKGDTIQFKSNIPRGDGSSQIDLTLRRDSLGNYQITDGISGCSEQSRCSLGYSLFFGPKVIDSQGKEIELTAEQKEHLANLRVKGIDPQRISQKQPTIAQTNSQKFFANVERVFTEFNGLGFYATLFFDEDSLLKWRDNVDRAFATAYLGTEYWSSAICGNYLDGEDEGIAYAETPQGFAQVAAHIEATRSEPIETPEGRKFIYKITFNVRNGDFDKDPRAPEKMKFNVVLKGERTANVFRQEQEVKRGSSFGRTGRNAIVQDSKAFFNEICMTFDETPLRWKVDDNKICNIIKESSSAATTVSVPASSAASAGASAQGDINDF